MSLESRSNKIVDEYIFKTGDSVKSIDDIYKRLRQKEMQDKKLVKVEKELRGEMTKVATATKAMSFATRAATTAVGHLSSMVMMRLSAALRSTARTAMDFQDWIGKDMEAVDRLTASVKNIIPTLDVARARTRLTTGDFKLNEDQLKATLKAAIHLTRVYKTDFATSLDKVSDVIKRGSSRSFKELGFNVDLLGTAAEKTEYALKAITERFGDMNIKVANANEAWDQFSNKLTDFFGKIGMKAINALEDLNKKTWDWHKGVLTLANAGIDILGNKMEGASNKAVVLAERFASLYEQQNAWVKWLAGDAVTKAMQRLHEMASAEEAWRESGLGLGVGATKGGGGVVAELPGGKLRGPGGKKPTGAAGRRRVKPRWSGKPVGGEVSGADWQIQQGAAALKSSQEQAVAERELSDAIQERARSLELANRAMKEGDDEVFLQRQWALNDIVRQNSELIMDLAVTSLASLADGFWDAADAALSGAQSWQQAMGGIAKAVALSAAKIATIEALKNVAYALHATGLTFLPGGQMAAGGAAAFWGSAAKWGLIAGVTGALGLGMSAAGAGGGGGAASGAGGGRAGTLNLGRTTIGKKVTADDYTIVINNYWGNEKNPSKNYIQQQVITKVATKNAA